MWNGYWIQEDNLVPIPLRSSGKQCNFCIHYPAVVLLKSLNSTITHASKEPINNTTSFVMC